VTEERQEHLLDLLIKKAVNGLDAVEQAEFDALDHASAADDLQSFEMTAAAINMAGTAYEPLPGHLHARIAADAERFFAPETVEAISATTEEPRRYVQPAISEPSGSSWFGWLGWAAAAAACIALAFNIWNTRKPIEVAVNTPPPASTPQPLTPAQMRDEMLRASTGMVKANWAAGNVKEMKQVSGDIVWSDEKQSGYMRFRGLPVNDGSKETYQLWIFDKTQDRATPIDGGTFDVTSDGEVVIPINAKLKAQEPTMFAITIEKPGGVVVSKREKIAALATVAPATS
jgi:hypothetical protein